MKFKNLFMAVLAGAALLTACQQEENLGTPKISVEPTVLSFGADEDSSPVQFTATRDWLIASIPDWVALSVDSGKASSEMHTITLSVDQNTEYNRTGDVIFTIGLAKAVLTVNQDGPLGEVKTGTGTLEDPFTVAGVIAYVNELGGDVQSPEKVYVKGKISEISEAYSAQYGNGTFKMTDDGAAGGDSFTAYRILYLGNAKWKAGDTQIEVGDEAIVYGYVVNYKGNTPETVQNGAFLYSLNGVDKGGNEEQQAGEAKGSGTLEDPYNPAGANAYIATLGADTNSDKDIYVKGIVSSVKEAYSTQYGNASFYISEDGTSTAEQFYVFRALYLNNAKYTSGDNIKAGDEVVICGKVVNYKGNTPETVQNQAYLYSLNNQGGSDEPTPTPGGENGTGTLDDPFNAAAAIAKAVETGETATADKYYIKGTVVGTPDISTSYGNATFYISDDGGATKFYIFRIYSYGGEKFTDANAFKEGDEVVVYAQIVNYKGNTPETVQGGELISVNNQGGSDEPTPTPGGESGTGTLDDPFNAAAAIAKAVETGETATADKYYIKGTVVGTPDISTSYGNATFYISDDGGATKFYIFRIYSYGGEKFTDANAFKEGDEVVVYAQIVNYKGNTPETVQGGELISVNNQGGGEEPGGDDSGDNDGIEGTTDASGITTVTLDKTYLAAHKDASVNSVVSYTNDTDYGTTPVTELRIYKGKNLRVTVAAGYTITEIGISAASNNGTNRGNNVSNPVTVESGATATLTAETDVKTSTITVEGNTSFVNLNAAAAQIRIEELTVKYKKAE